MPIALAQEQVAITARKIAVNGFVPRNLLDAVDGGGQALVNLAGLILATKRDEFMIECPPSAPVAHI